MVFIHSCEMADPNLGDSPELESRVSEACAF
jgi:hypothetical protein